MFHTITKLYTMLSAPVPAATAATVTDKGKYIHFGATTIYCDENNICSVYYPDATAASAATEPAITTMIVSSA